MKYDDHYGITEKSFTLLMATLTNCAEVTEAVLFGSRAKGNYTNGSDIDIAIKGTTSPAVALDLSARLNEQLPTPYHYDIVDYSSISNKELREHIDRVGKVIFMR